MNFVTFEIKKAKNFTHSNKFSAKSVKISAGQQKYNINMVK